MESEPAASASASSFDMRGAPPTVSVKTEEEDGWVQVEKKNKKHKKRRKRGDSDQADRSRRRRRRCANEENEDERKTPCEVAELPPRRERKTP